MEEWKDTYASIGMENQSAVDNTMPVRVMNYDAAEYMAQTERKEYYPVITLVLYFDCKRRWTGPKNLLQKMAVPPELQPYCNDYRINVFEIAWLSEEEVQMFQSDFKYVADYLVQQRRDHDYIPSVETIQHVEETLALLSAVTNDNRFTEAYNESVRKGAVGKTMDEYLDKVESRGYNRGLQYGMKQGISKGISKGISQGITQGVSQGDKERLQKVVNNMSAMGMSDEIIARACDESVERIRELLKQ